MIKTIVVKFEIRTGYCLGTLLRRIQNCYYTLLEKYCCPVFLKLHLRESAPKRLLFIMTEYIRQKYRPRGVCPLYWFALKGESSTEKIRMMKSRE